MVQQLLSSIPLTLFTLVYVYIWGGGIVLVRGCCCPGGCCPGELSGGRCPFPISKCRATACSQESNRIKVVIRNRLTCICPVKLLCHKGRAMSRAERRERVRSGRRAALP